MAAVIRGSAREIALVDLAKLRTERERRRRRECPVPDSSPVNARSPASADLRRAGERVKCLVLGRDRLAYAPWAFGALVEGRRSDSVLTGSDLMNLSSSSLRSYSGKLDSLGCRCAIWRL
jgi:hypothetical protein